MHRIDHYMIRQLAIASIFITLAATVVLLFAMSFRLLSLVIESAATLGIFMNLMALTIPTFLSLVLPIAVAIATVFVYHKLSVDSEIVVMRAAGISPLRLAAPALIVGGGVTVLCFIVTLALSPWANSELVKLQYEVRNNYSVLLIRAGTFNDIAPGLTFYTRGRDKDGRLEGILIHDTRKDDVTVTIMAKNGTIVSEDGKEPKIVVFDGVRQEFNRADNTLNQLDFQNYTFDLRLLASGSYSRVPDPREIPVHGLIEQYHEYKNLDYAYSRRFLAEIFQRFATPLLAVGFASICAALMLGGEFNRRGMGKRLVSAGLAITLMQGVSLWITNLVTKELALAPTLYCTTLLPLLIGLWLLTRVPVYTQPSGAEARA
ncbi:MAG: LPS export ABC transporter permease LptF [Alphaproteobacteria bacterium]|nr:LPS export ABC transporter permease LptF [Alphaproteobacteria bacterium]